MSFYGSTESRRLGFRPPGQARYAAPFRLWWQLVLAHVCPPQLLASRRYTPVGFSCALFGGLI